MSMCLDTLEKRTSAIGSEQSFRQTNTRNGETLLTKNWAMKIAHGVIKRLLLLAIGHQGRGDHPCCDARQIARARSSRIERRSAYDLTEINICSHSPPG